MNQMSFDQIITQSPVLLPTVKAVLLENTETLGEAGREAVTEELLEYEKDVLQGAEAFLSSLHQGPVT